MSDLLWHLPIALVVTYPLGTIIVLLFALLIYWQFKE